MTTFPASQIHAVRDLHEACLGVPFVLVGAAALGCQFEGWEETRDLDLTVVASVDELTTITSRLPGWRQEPGVEHAWKTPGGVAVDILPAGPEIIAAGEIVWPGSGRRMIMTGFRLVIAWNRLIALDRALELRVAPIPAIMLLKMVAYLDRPLGRIRDLRDIANIWSRYEESSDGRFQDLVTNAEMSFEHAGAFLIGHELSNRLDSRERSVVGAFLTKLRDESDEHNTMDSMMRQGPRIWREEPASYLSCADALQRGLDGQ